MRLIAPVVSLLSFDAWRAAYHDLTDEEQRAYNDCIGAMYPDQNHADRQAVRAFLGTVPPEVDVVEVGGWTGQLAADMLKLFPGVKSWTNIETSGVAAQHQACGSRRYRLEQPERWYWWHQDDLTYEGDVLIACHVLEHFPADDVADILRCFPDARWLHVEAPLPDGMPPNWDGYTGTHILELSWQGLEALLAEDGWEPYGQAGIARSFRREVSCD